MSAMWASPHTGKITRPAGPLQNSFHFLGGVRLEHQESRDLKNAAGFQDPLEKSLASAPKKLTPGVMSLFSKLEMCAFVDQQGDLIL